VSRFGSVLLSDRNSLAANSCWLLDMPRRYWAAA